jgi:AcrR family transcriptional regulator
VGAEATAGTAVEEGEDALRDRLLAAAARVVARQGYEGTKITDIVREAGLSTGAIYGRFRSKNDLIRAAIVERADHAARIGDVAGARVADLLARSGRVTSGALSDVEAMRLEAFVAARREPEVAQALLDATTEWRAAVRPWVDAALEDRTVSVALDPEAVLFFVRTVGLGLLVQRAAGMTAPDPGAWDVLLAKVIASLGDREPERNGT